MKLRRLSVLFVLPLLALSACQKRGAGPQLVPAAADPHAREAEAARADSILMAERERRAREVAEAERLAAAQREAQIQAIRDALTETVYFNYDEDALVGEAEAKLTRKIEILKASPSVRLRVEGHADERGSTEYNLALGQRRATSVIEFFTAYGLAADRFQAISYGKERPVVEGTGETAWAQNRRAEFKVIAGESDLK